MEILLWILCVPGGIYSHIVWLKSYHIAINSSISFLFITLVFGQQNLGNIQTIINYNLIKHKSLVTSYIIFFYTG